MPTGTILLRIHSKLILDSLTIGGFIFFEERGVSFEISNSSMSGSKSVLQAIICSTNDSDTRLMLNSLVSLIFFKVSFSLPSQPLLAGANIIVGGFEQTPLK